MHTMVKEIVVPKEANLANLEAAVAESFKHQLEMDYHESIFDFVADNAPEVYEEAGEYKVTVNVTITQSCT